MARVRFLAVAALVLAALAGSARGEAPKKKTAPAPATAAVRKAVDQLAKTPELATGTFGFYLATAAKPEVPLVAKNHRQSFIPASTLKTLTTGAALQALGSDFRFETPLWHDPDSGDVLISGSGDPSLARGGWDELFHAWTEALREKGVREVRGRVIAVEDAWETQELPGGWTWLDIGNYYAPPLSPLTFHDNEFRLWFDTGGNAGDRATLVDAEPWPGGLRVIDELRVGAPGSGDAAYVFGGPGAAVYHVRGTLAADAGKEYIRAALPDPALFCAQEFTKWLMAREVPVHGAATTTRRLRLAGTPWERNARTETLSTVASAPLAELLVPINHHSLNLDCECLLRTLGAGRADEGARAIRRRLAEAGLPLAGFEQTDGCGLSRTNMITPELLARAQALFASGKTGADYVASLPVVGEGGSTLRRLGATGGPSLVHAKSGSVERVKCYTGVVVREGAPRFVFAVMCNNYDGSTAALYPGLGALFEALAGL